MSVRRRASGRAHYNYFRDYDPAIGRYTESDPIGLAGGEWSTFNYVGSDPLLLIDTTGLAGVPGGGKGFARRNRECNAEETRRCQNDCGSKGMRSCKVAQLFVPVRSVNRDGTVVTVNTWKDQGFSCDCNDPDECKNVAKGVAAGTILYWIISEGSRIFFPPRNLVPVP